MKDCLFPFSNHQVQGMKRIIYWRKFRRNMPFIFLITLSIIFYTWSIGTPMPSAGDGPEYCFMLYNFTHHLSIRGTEDEMREYSASLKENGYFQKFNYERCPQWPYSHGFTVKDRRWYPVHTSTFSLLASPIALVLRGLQLDEFKALVVLNALLMIGVFWVTWCCFPAKEPVRIAVLLGHLLSPVLFYLNWPSSEVFIYAMVYFSLVSALNKKTKTGLFFAALATSQNQALVALPVSLCVGLMWKTVTQRQRERRKPLWTRAVFREFFLIGLAASPIIFHPLYYCLTLGCPSILAGVYLHPGIRAASPTYMSWARFWDLFFGLDQGMFLGNAAVVVLFFGFVLVNLAKRTLSRLWIPMVALLTSLSVTTIVNWNSGSIGPSRYASWIFVFLLVFVSMEMCRIRNNFLRRSLLVTILISILVHGAFLFGRPCRDFFYTRFNALSTLVLDYCPHLYSPPPDVFITRARGYEFITQFSPIGESGTHVLPLTINHGRHWTKILTSQFTYDAISEGIVMNEKFRPYVTEKLLSAKQMKRDYVYIVLPSYSCCQNTGVFHDFHVGNARLPVSLSSGFYPYPQNCNVIWTSGDARLTFVMPGDASMEEHEFELDVTSASGPKNIEVYSNGKKALLFSADKRKTVRLHISGIGGGSPVILEFRQRGIASPHDVNPSSPDCRPMGIGLIAMRHIGSPTKEQSP